jgi:hypothetical protein
MTRKETMQTETMLGRLTALGISRPDAEALRRISMTLQRWFELECGNSDDFKSWSLVRGHAPRREFYRDAETQAAKWRTVGEFTYADDGAPYLETHFHDRNVPVYARVTDREAGANKRLAAIMAKYPDLVAYVQTDPRGAALYILEKAQTPQPYDQFYSRGIAVHK